MTLIYQSRVSRPRTHVILVGVGAYPYLKNGSEKRKIFAHHEEMGQLESPPSSVRQIADWFRSNFRNSDRPLGSLEILCSGSSTYVDAGRSIPVEPATISNVKTAVDAWADRCDRNADNLAILYFCGHGVVSGQEQSLLLQDFGGDTNSPFSDAIAFSKFRTGMRRRKVRNQCFLLDACRSVSEEYLKTYGSEFTGHPLIAGSLLGSLPGTNSQVFYASELGSAAYGKKGKPSMFAEALMGALGGLGGWEDAKGSWIVTTSRLANAINAYSATRTYLEAMPEQLCTSDGVAREIALHELQQRPNVPVLVSCDPSAATEHADFHCVRGGTQIARGSSGPFAVWRTDLPPAQYDFHAKFVGTPPKYTDGTARERIVFPPFTSVAIRCA